MRSKSKVMQGFKVVKVSNSGDMYSCAPKDAAVMYGVGRWASPNHGCGPLCVFTTFGRAEKFIAKFLLPLPLGRYKIFRCRYRPSKDKAVWDIGISGTTTMGPPRPLSSLPMGTRLARAVRICKGKNAECHTTF